MNTSITLLIPQKTDIEHEQVFSAWIEKGGQVKRLDKFWIKDEELAKQRIAVYGNQAFAFVVAQIYNVELLSPDDTLVARLESKCTKRTIQLRQIGQLSAKDFPIFIKPVIPNIFIAGIFQNIEDFKKVSEGLTMICLLALQAKIYLTRLSRLLDKSYTC